MRWGSDLPYKSNLAVLMIHSQRILLCGRSLFLLGLAAALAERPGLEVTLLDSLPASPNLPPPALIISECGGHNPFTPLLFQSSALLLELDILHNRLTLISSQQMEVTDMNHLVHLISQFATAPA